MNDADRTPAKIEKKTREWFVHLDDKGEIDRSFKIVEGYFSCCGMGGPYIKVKEVLVDN